MKYTFMIRVTFIETNGTEHSVEGEVGQSLMDVAMQNMVPGLDADCGGNVSCATCHGYIDTVWREKTPAPTSDEVMMLKIAKSYTSDSRLTCQIQVSEGLNGLVVRWSECQG